MPCQTESHKINMAAAKQEVFISQVEDIGLQERNMNDLTNAFGVQLFNETGQCGAVKPNRKWDTKHGGLQHLSQITDETLTVAT